jgi:hypothetical protein
MTTRFDVATAVVGALLAGFKAWDTTQKYKAEQAALNNKEISK